MSQVYRRAKGAAFRRQIDWITHDIRALLIDSTIYTPNFDKDSSLGDIPARAIVATSVPLTGKTLDIDRCKADPVMFPMVLKGYVGAVVLYSKGFVIGETFLLVYLDDIEKFPFLANGADVELKWDTESGIFKI